jgi:glycosyltransferase involved in cell wall biosynthesis
MRGLIWDKLSPAFRLSVKCAVLGFVRKCRAILHRDHSRQDRLPVAKAANQSHGPAVVVFDDRVPSLGSDAGSERMFLILRALAKWTRPLLISTSRQQNTDSEKLLGAQGVEIGDLIDYRKLIRTGHFRVAILSRPHVAEALIDSLRKIDKNLRIVFDTVDIGFVRLEREYKLTGDQRFALEAGRAKKLETRLARASDRVWCVTATDMAALSKEAPRTPIDIIPTIHPLRDRGVAFEKREGLVFIGGFLHRPNIDAARYFLEEIFPLVSQTLQSVRVTIIGGNVPAEIAEYSSPKISVTGYVPDVEPLFGSARVFVAPMRFGSGIKGKIGHALSFGLPVVTTSIGAEGMDLVHGHHAMISDDPEEFAGAIVKVYNDRELWQRLSDNGYAHARANFTSEVVGEKVRNAIHALIQKQDGDKPTARVEAEVIHP